MAVVLNTLVSLFFYLRSIIPAYRPVEPLERSAGGGFAPPPWAAGAAVPAGAASLALGLAVGAAWGFVDGTAAL